MEETYRKKVGRAHLKAYGQYFTPPEAAAFMARWACAGGGRVLDPAAGGSVFLKAAAEAAPTCRLTGYEVDPLMLDHFGNPAGAELRCGDYLKSDWSERYDAILCNPPYGRFQSIPNREELLEELFVRTGVRYSRYTNLSVLFLLKSICQLSDRGRLAYLLPLEFLNSGYGESVKRLLVEQRLLRAVLRFEQDGELFPDAVTTCCILLLDREEKNTASFYSLGSLKELDTLSPEGVRQVPYERLEPRAKWLPLFGEETERSGGLRPLSDFCTVSRGVATGANGFFCLSAPQIEALRLKKSYFRPCICRSAHVTGSLFTAEDFEALSQRGRPVWLLDIREEPDEALKAYLRQGVALGVDRKYLPAHREPWYAMEQREAAPIWISSACRKTLRVVRNLTGVGNLTTFHGIYVRPEFEADTDLLFCTLLAPSVQRLLLSNRKEMGGGLTKFQPGDLNDAPIPDLEAFSPKDRAAVLELYRQLLEGSCPDLEQGLDSILEKYI